MRKSILACHIMFSEKEIVSVTRKEEKQEISSTKHKGGLFWIQLCWRWQLTVSNQHLSMSCGFDLRSKLMSHLPPSLFLSSSHMGFTPSWNKKFLSSPLLFWNLSSKFTVRHQWSGHVSTGTYPIKIRTDVQIMLQHSKLNMVCTSYNYIYSKLLSTVEPRYNEVLGAMKITLLYQVSHYIRVNKQRNIKSWDQQNYLVIRGFCYIRPLYNEVPLYCICIAANMSV